MKICKNCGQQFPVKINIDGQIKYLTSRKFCLKCSPLNGHNRRTYIIKVEDGKAYCARCQEIKNKSEFYIRKGSGKPFSYCISCQEKVKNLKFDEKIERIIQERGGVCRDCGVSYPIPVYEFYSDKNIYRLSKARNMSLQRLKEEIKNYIMLCKNCSTIRKWAE